MNPQVLRNIESPQAHISITQDYILFVAPRTTSPGDILQFQQILERPMTEWARRSADDLAKYLSSIIELRGCLIDHRHDSSPRIFLSPEMLALVQTSVSTVHRCRHEEPRRWMEFTIPTRPVRVIGGSLEWEQELGITTMEDIVRDAPERQNLQQLLFTLSRERHYLGYEEPSPFLFAATQVGQAQLV